MSDDRRREDFEQLVTDILVGLGDRLELRDGPDVDEAREAVMRELLAYCVPRYLLRQAVARIAELGAEVKAQNDERPAD